MTATTASTARKASPTKRLIALLIAFAAAVALSIAVAPATAYADESIAIEITHVNETVPVGDYEHFEVAVTNTGDETIRVASLECSFDGRGLPSEDFYDLGPGDSISRGYAVTPSRLPDSGEMQFEARVRTEEGGEFSATASVNVIPSIADCDIVFEDQTYTGSEVTPIPTVTLNGRELEYGTDFLVSGYKDNVEAGEARALVLARYTVVGGSTWRTFNIVLPTYTLIWLDAQGGELLTRTYAMGEDRPSFEGEAPGKASDGQYTYAFAGWRLKEGSETGSATYEPTYDATPIPAEEYTITFVNWDGTTLQSGKVAKGTTPAYEGAEPTRPADKENTYIFADWTPEIVPAAADATYTATYEATPVPKPAEKATLTFDLAGGTLDGKTGSITIEANVGDTIKLPAAPKREGYTFKYWKGSQYAAGAVYKVEGDHTFTAEWEKNASSDSGDSGKKSPLPATGDDNAAALTLCTLMALASLALLSGSAALRRRGAAYKGKHSAR